jgi:hypothetical protein
MEHEISEFDFVFLSYDEPNAERLYSELLTIVPWAKRVHGVKGFDAAHRACADAADTDFFVTVDGDNWVDPEFLSAKIKIHSGQEDHAWTWAGRNNINGLVYGNGGLKLWSKAFVRQMNSHENSDDDAAKVDFCWNHKYHEVFGTYSTSQINGTPYQAFRAGYREGVKMSLDSGRKVRPSEFKNRIWIYNLHKLMIWCTVGSDIEHGIWAIYGARMGAHDCNLTDTDYTMISDYDWFQERWKNLKDVDPHAASAQVGHELRRGLGIDIADLDPQQSRFFRSIYINPPRPFLDYDQLRHLAAK